jgi:hypothetical protein
MKVLAKTVFKPLFYALTEITSFSVKVMWDSLFDLSCFYCSSQKCINMIFKLHSFEVGHAPFTASLDDLVGEIAFVGVVLDFELVFKPGDCKHVS